MVRPIKPRTLNASPKSFYFKPQGIPMRFLDEVVLEADEFEALKLHDYDNLDHVSSAKMMDISQPTFARTLDRAYKKLALAIIDGQAIRINKP